MGQRARRRSRRWPGRSADPARPPAAHDRALASFRARFPAPAGWLTTWSTRPRRRTRWAGRTATTTTRCGPTSCSAWSLPHAPLEPDPAALRPVGAALLTPLGPRSLAPDAPGYRRRHRGGPAERDGAYHQGTVWPWLIGRYGTRAGKDGLDNGELFRRH